MILRGCKLKNVEWIMGIVVYTGVDTAIMMNGSQPHTKISNIERKVNKFIINILIFEILCSFFSAGYCYYGCHRKYTFENFLTENSPSCV
jgi:magnesium-transporting ATPase (P-type)